MAVDELTCGQGGSNGLEIITRINELAKLNPRATVTLSASGAVASQDFDDADFAVMEMFDLAKTQRTGFVAEVGSFSLKNNSGFDFESVIFVTNINLAFSGELEIAGFIDGAQVGASHFIQGRGANKPVSISWQSDIALPATATIDIRAKNADSGTITVDYHSCNASIGAEWAETLQVTTP